MTGTNQDVPAEDDDLLPRLFRAIGPSPTLPQDMRRSWENVFSRELAVHNAERRKQRRGYFGAACAAAVALTAALLYLQRGAPAEAAVANVVLVAGTAEAVAANTKQPVHEGAQLHAGQTIRVGPQALLAIRYRDADVRLNSDAEMVLHPTRLELVRGEIYVDAGASPRPGPTLEIATPLGTLAHVGTQFVVFVGDDEMRAAVREGSIAINSAGDRRIVSAVDGPIEVVVTSTGAPTTRPVAGTGGIWTWVVDAAPRYTMDGHNADEFLLWASRQLGAQLDYTNDATRVHAQTVVLHGDVRTLSVVHGLEILSATTDLDIDRSTPAVVRVSTRNLSN